MKNKIFKNSFWIPAFAGMTIAASLFFAGQAKADGPDIVTVTIRDGSTTAFSATTTLPEVGSPLIPVSPTDLSTTTPVSARSVLAVLMSLDANSTAFNITDLKYYDSFNSFYINCISVPASSPSPDCANWTYAVNGSYPWDGVNQKILNNGDVVYLFFGPSRQAVVSTATPTVGVPFKATAESYDLASGTYLPSPGLVLGVVKFNSDFSFTEIATSTADANGEAMFTMNATGTLAVGIYEDNYFPSASIEIIDAPAPEPTPSSGGSVIIIPSSSGGGGSSAPAAARIDLAKAVEFLNSKQNDDGSFGSALITDWAAMAIASVNPNSTAAQKIKNYLLTDPSALGGMNQVSDYARRSMALMSLNISPYNGTQTNYVKKITDSFDGRQFGDASIFNDDIFALLVLSRAGYGADDKIMQSDVDFILSKQQADGSYQGVDLTAAAIQALKPFSSLNGVSVAIGKARNFLVSAQSSGGGFGNASATSWALAAIASMGESGVDWLKNNQTPESYLASGQGADGGLEKDNTPANRVWSTAYAIPAVQGKSWLSLMGSFAKEIEETVVNYPTGGVGQSENLIATSSSSWQATSTPGLIETATSTEQVLEQATSTHELFENEKIENKPAELAEKSISPEIKPAAVLGEKITKRNRVATAKNNEEIKPEQTENEQNNLTKPEAQNPTVEKPAEKNQVNATAKKILYVAGAGTVLAGLFLLLKMLGFLL